MDPRVSAELARPAPGAGWGRASVVGMGDDARHQYHRQPPRDGGVRAGMCFLQRRRKRMCHTGPGPPRPGTPSPRGERRVGRCRSACPFPVLASGRAG